MEKEKEKRGRRAASLDTPMTPASEAMVVAIVRSFFGNHYK